MDPNAFDRFDARVSEDFVAVRKIHKRMIDLLGADSATQQIVVATATEDKLERDLTEPT
jgi:hypothetical protein